MRIDDARLERTASGNGLLAQEEECNTPGFGGILMIEKNAHPVRIVSSLR